MEPIVASGADGVEPLGGGPAKASTPSPAIKNKKALCCNNTTSLILKKLMALPLEPSLPGVSLAYLTLFQRSCTPLLHETKLKLQLYEK